jgi:hypothetical protein
MQSIIKRFDRAPLEDRLLRANPAQPPKSRRPGGPSGAPAPAMAGSAPAQGMNPAAGPRGDRRGGARRPAGSSAPRQGGKTGPQSAFAEELAKAL